MIPILITIFTYIPYILIAYFTCQILTRLTSPINKIIKQEFSNEENNTTQPILNEENNTTQPMLNHTHTHTSYLYPGSYLL